jgi:hypothetical protein
MQLINKFSVFLHLVTNICLITASNESFCSDGTIDSAFTLQNQTILIRKDKIWFFDSQTNLVNNKSMTFKQLFNGLLKHNYINIIYLLLNFFASNRSQN